MAVQKLTRTHSKNSCKKFNIHLKLLKQVVVLTLNSTSVHNILLFHFPDGLYFINIHWTCSRLLLLFSSSSFFFFSSSSSSSSPSISLLPGQASGCISQIQNTFPSFVDPVASSKIFPFFLISFHMCPSILSLTFVLSCIPSTLLSHTCLSFLLLPFPMRCPNPLSSHLSTISVTGSWFTNLAISNYISSCFPHAFFTYLITVPVNPTFIFC